MKQIAAAIYAKLGSVTTPGSFHALMNGRYYYLQAPQNTGFPLCVYSIDSIGQEDQFGGSRILTANVSFDLYFEDKAGTAAVFDVEEALMTLLDQAQLTVLDPTVPPVPSTTYGRVTLQCLSRGVPSVNDEFIVSTATYSLFSTRTA